MNCQDALLLQSESLVKFLLSFFVAFTNFLICYQFSINAIKFIIVFNFYVIGILCWLVGDESFLLETFIPFTNSPRGLRSHILDVLATGYN